MHCMNPHQTSSSKDSKKMICIVTHRLTLLIFVAIACNFHEAPLLPFFLYRSTPKFPPLCLT